MCFVTYGLDQKLTFAEERNDFEKPVQWTLFSEQQAEERVDKLVFISTLDKLPNHKKVRFKL